MLSAVRSLLGSMPPYVRKHWAVSGFSAANLYQTPVDGGEAGVASGFVDVALCRLDALPVTAAIFERYGGHGVHGGANVLVYNCINGSGSPGAVYHPISAPDLSNMFLIVGVHNGAGLQIWSKRRLNESAAISGYTPGAAARATIGARAGGTVPAPFVSFVAGLTARGVPSDQQIRALFDYVRAHGNLPWSWPTRDAYDTDIAAIAPRHWYEADAYTGGASLATLPNRGTAGGNLGVEAGTIALPSADAVLGGALSIKLDGSQNLISSLSPSEFRFRHNGIGRDEFILIVPNTVAPTFQGLLCSRPSGGYDVGSALYLNTTNLSHVIGNGSANLFTPTPTMASGVIEAGKPYLLRISYAEGKTPEGALYRNGVVVASGASSADAPSSVDPTSTLRVGAFPDVLRFSGSIALVIMLDRIATDSEAQTISDYVRTKYGVGIVTVTHRWSVPDAMQGSSDVDGDPGPIALQDTATGLSQHEMAKVGDVRLRVFDAKRSGEKSYGAMAFSAASVLQTVSASGGIRGASQFWIAVEFTPWSTSGATQDLVAVSENGGQGYQLYVSGATIGATVRDASSNKVTTSGSVIGSGDLGNPQIAVLNYDGAKVDVYYKRLLVATIAASGFVPWNQPMRIGNRTDGGTSAVFMSVSRVHGADGSSLSAGDISSLYNALENGLPIPRLPSAQHDYCISLDVRENGGPQNGVPATVKDRLGTDHLTRVGGLQVVVGPNATRGLAPYSATDAIASTASGGLRGGTAFHVIVDIVLTAASGGASTILSNSNPAGTNGWLIMMTATSVRVTVNGVTTDWVYHDMIVGQRARVLLQYDGATLWCYTKTRSISIAVTGYTAPTSYMLVGAWSVPGNSACTYAYAEHVQGGDGQTLTPGEITALFADLTAAPPIVAGKTLRRWRLEQDIAEAGGKVPVIVKERIAGTDPMVVVGAPLQLAARTERTWSYETRPIAHGARDLGPSAYYSVASGYAGITAGFTITVVGILEPVTTGAGRTLASKVTAAMSGWSMYTTGLNGALYFSIGNGSVTALSPGYTVPAAELGRVQIMQGVWDAVNQKIRLYIKRAEVASGQTWAQVYAGSPNPMMIGHYIGGTVGGGFSILALGCADGIATLAELQAQYDAIIANDYRYVPIPSKPSAEWWDFSRSLVDGALPATLPGQKGVYNLARTGTPTLGPIYARAAA